MNKWNTLSSSSIESLFMDLKNTLANKSGQPTGARKIRYLLLLQKNCVSFPEQTGWININPSGRSCGPGISFLRPDKGVQHLSHRLLALELHEGEALDAGLAIKNSTQKKTPKKHTQKNTPKKTHPKKPT